MLALMINWRMTIEVLVFAIGIYLVLRFLRETRGSGVVRGLILIVSFGLAGFLILIEAFDLPRLRVAFNLLVSVAFVGLIVIFQPEIRRAIVRLGDTPIFSIFRKGEVKVAQRLLRSVARLSKDRIGALIALEREGSLAALTDTGIQIDAELNSYLIESIFYPGTALHDGAMVIRDDRIVAASCLLPLSQNPTVDKRLGTRHRAALGLAEETDAFAIIVSEETGKVSAAVGGKLHHDVSLEDLERLIRDGARVSEARANARRGTKIGWFASALHDPWRKFAAIGLALGLWYYLDGRVSKTATVEVALMVRDSGDPRNSAEIANRLEANEGVLQVVLPRRDYTADASDFKDSTGAELSRIQLRLKGSNRVVDDLLQDLLFVFEPKALDLVEAQKWGYLEFDKTALRPQRNTAAYEEILKEMEMEPARIRIQLRRNGSLTFGPDNKSVQLRLGSPGLEARLRPKEVRFEPPEVTLRGPQEVLSQIDREQVVFVGDVSLPANTPRLEVRVQLQLRPEFARVQIDGDALFAVYPIAPDFRSITFKRVPVLLDDGMLQYDKNGNRQFVLKNGDLIGQSVELESLTLDVTGELHRQLDPLREDPLKLRNWARQHLRLVVPVTEGDLQLQPDGTDGAPRKPDIRIHDATRTYLPDRDYRGVNVPQVEIRCKTR